jgi:hypothetical protein
MLMFVFATPFSDFESIPHDPTPEAGTTIPETAFDSPHAYRKARFLKIQTPFILSAIYTRHAAHFIDTSPPARQYLLVISATHPFSLTAGGQQTSVLVLTHQPFQHPCCPHNRLLRPSLLHCRQYHRPVVGRPPSTLHLHFDSLVGAPDK